MANEGFFSREELDRVILPTKTYETRVRSEPNCPKCRLYQSCSKGKILPEGDGANPGILFVGESPGKDGNHFTPGARMLLDSVIRELGQDRKSFRTVDAINCPTPGHQEPNGIQINSCRPILWNEIQESRPRVIIPLGIHALDSIIGHRFKAGLYGIERWRGWAIPDQQLKSWICPTFHPDFVLRNTGQRDQVPEEIGFHYDKGKFFGRVARLIFKQDLEKAFRFQCQPVPDFGDELAKIEICRDVKQIRARLSDLIRRPPEFLAFDYETTGIKPHAPGHKIVCASFAVTGESAFAFPFLSELEDLWCEVLTGPSKKIAGNMKFEELWTRYKLQIEVRNWYLDTVLAAHTLDNRQRITSVKFQAYVRFGLMNYDQDIKPFIGQDEDEDTKDGNAFNRILRAPTETLLKYCGVDSMVEFRQAFAMDQELLQYSLKSVPF